VAAHEAAHDTSALLERLRAHNRQRLGRFKQPADIHLIDSLPRSATGKVLRRQLRELLNTSRRKDS